MMERLTYKQAYDKIIDAYFKDQIRPCSPRFCFCGNLSDNKLGWNKGTELYNSDEYGKMEAALFSFFPITQIKPGLLCHNDDDKWIVDIYHMVNYEDLLFAGMSAALDVLKQIHIERGEVIDEPEIKFTKRNLQPA